MIDFVFITSKDSNITRFTVYPYLGIGYISSALIKNGYKGKIYDVAAHNLSFIDIYKKLAEDKPRYVGFSMMSKSLPFFYKLLPVIKKAVPEAIVFAGGAHVTSDPQIIFDLGLEYGLRGDCETSIIDFITGLEKNDLKTNIEGLIINQIDRKIINDACVLKTLYLDIDPAYELYDLDAYADITYPGVKSFSMDTSRGCPYNCSFCSNHSKTKVRLRDSETIFRQLDTLVNKNNVKWIAFVDDLFTYKKDRVIEICNYIIDNRLNFKWSCITRVDKLDEEILKIMKSAGFYNIIFGVESGSDKIRKLDNKDISNDQYKKIIKLCNKHKIKTFNTYIIGHPNETKKQMFDTIKYSIKLNADLSHYQLMSPLPSSPVFKQGVFENKFTIDAWSKYMRGEIKEPFYFPDSTTLLIVKIIHILAYAFYYLLPNKFVLIWSKVICILWYRLKAFVYYRKKEM